MRTKNLIGQRFGNGVVISFAGHKYRGKTSKRSCRVWRLLCDCGKEYDAITEFLSNGDVKSCGCRHKVFHSLPDNNISCISLQRYIKSVRQNARRRNHLFTVSIDYLAKLLELQNCCCALSGVPISLEDGTASLDRIDSAMPYQDDNVQWVHRVINYMKNTLGQNDFIDWCRKVTLHVDN